MSRSLSLSVVDLGVLNYSHAWEMQRHHHDAVLRRRESGAAEAGRLLLVEHSPPVITVSRRPDGRRHLLATHEALRSAGIEVCETDRGGDITYHGPGQLVAYPIIDLNAVGLGLHAYMRLLEDVVIATLARFGIAGTREPGATGVWIKRSLQPERGHAAKVCAMGVRVRRWVTMHGLALNVTTNLDHFGLIVPCGLQGRTVTSIERELGERCPGMADVKAALELAFRSALAGLSRGSDPPGHPR